MKYSAFNSLSRFLHITTLSFLLSFAAFSQTNFERGKVLFDNGEYASAIKHLKKNSKRVKSLYYIGLSYEKLGDIKNSRKYYKQGFEKGVSIALKQITKNFHNFAEKGNYLKIREKYSDDFFFANKSEFEYKRISSDFKDSDKWKKKRIILSLFSAKMNDPNRLFISHEVTTKLRIVRKPLPGYTSEARKNGTSGRIRVLVGFLKTGQIGFVILLNNLPHGLNEKAITAAQSIVFEPAMVQDEKVSTVSLVTYSFNVF